MDWKENTALWLRLASHEKFAIISDFDGTLSPIVNDPESARPDPKVVPLLAALQNQIELVGVLSGRMAEDVADRVGVPGVVTIGNHGFERFQGGRIVIPDQAKPYRKALQKTAEKIRKHMLPGMQLEDKGITISVHYRQAENEEAVREKFLPQLQKWADKYELDLFQGRKVFELRPPVDVDKGTAFVQIIEDFKVQAAVYLGDDTTDATVFIAAKKLREMGLCEAYGIGVHSPNTPEEILQNEDYSAEGVEGVAAFLSMVVDSLRASST
ncbi:trehalose-phosphatase [bacterium]|nr:trehalose-phosphatase [bacterium]